MTAKAKQLTEALRDAMAAARAADPGPGLENDGGTCNFDSPAFFTRMRTATVEAAAHAAGVDVWQSTWWGRRCFFLNVMHGQAERRTKMAKAACHALREAAPDGVEVRMYYQCD